MNGEPVAEAVTNLHATCRLYRVTGHGRGPLDIAAADEAGAIAGCRQLYDVPANVDLKAVQTGGAE